MVVGVGVEGELAREFAGGGVHDSDVEVEETWTLVSPSFPGRTGAFA